VSHPQMPEEPRSDPNSGYSSVEERMGQTPVDAARRLLNWRLTRTLAPIGVIHTTQRDFAIHTPCRGDGFTFEVSVVGVWTGQGSQPHLLQAIGRAEFEHHKYVEKQLRQLSRGFEPDAFAAAEQRMNDELALPLTYEMGLLSCRSRVRVGPDDSLRTHLQQQWSDRSNEGAQHARAKRHIEHLAELRELWGRFLKQMDDPLAAQAVRLANDPRLVGDIATEVAEKNQRTATELREIVDQAIADHERFDLYDFVISYDSALQKLMRHVGMPTTTENGAGQIVA